MFLVKGRWYTGFLAMASLGTQQRDTFFTQMQIFKHTNQPQVAQAYKLYLFLQTTGNAI